MSAVIKDLPKKYGCYVIPSEFAPMEWVNVHRLLKPAVDRSGGRWSMPALLRALCAGEYQLWVVKDGDETIASAVTQICGYPHLSMVSVQFLGGTGFDEWGDGLLATIESFAKSSGCHGVEAVGRFGFWPFFKKQGYGRSFCTYDKLLEDK